MRSRSLIIYFILIYAVLFLFLSIFLKSCKQVLNYWNSLAYIKCLETYYSFNEIYIYIYISLSNIWYSHFHSRSNTWSREISVLPFLLRQSSKVITKLKREHNVLISMFKDDGLCFRTQTGSRWLQSSPKLFQTPDPFRSFKMQNFFIIFFSNWSLTLRSWDINFRDGWGYL